MNLSKLLIQNRIKGLESNTDARALWTIVVPLHISCERGVDNSLFGRKFNLYFLTLEAKQHKISKVYSDGR
jgi:hypothetical protein